MTSALSLDSMLEDQVNKMGGSGMFNGDLDLTTEIIDKDNSSGVIRKSINKGILSNI